MKIAVIDDQPKEGEHLLTMVKMQFAKYGISLSQSDYYSSGDSFFKNWRPGMYSIIFLDIFLTQENGIEVAKTIRKLDYRVPIIFCSSSNEFAAESYEVQANYYLVKPVEENKVDHMIHQLNLLRKEDDIIELPDKTRVPLSQFIFSEYHNHLITIYLKGNKTIKTWSSQSDLIALLEPYNYFLAINPGTIINLKEVTSFEEYNFLMSDGNTLPISKRKKKELVNAYKNYLFEELRKE